MKSEQSTISKFLFLTVAAIAAALSFNVSLTRAQSSHIQDAAHFAARRYCTSKDKGVNTDMSWSLAERDTKLIYKEAVRQNGYVLRPMAQQYIDAICGERLEPIYQKNTASGEQSKVCGISSAQATQALSGQKIRVKTKQCLLEIN